MKDNLKNYIKDFYQNFTDIELNKGIALFERENCKAKDHILKNGQICDKMFFAESSVTRCYYLDNEGENQTLWMKPQQQLITEYKSFVSGEKSTFSLQFYEETEVFSITKDKLWDLYSSDQNWSLFGIRLTEALHVTLIDVFVNLLANDATSNYRYIEYMFPKFIQVAPLKDIASMLQVHQLLYLESEQESRSKKNFLNKC